MRLTNTQQAFLELVRAGLWEYSVKFSGESLKITEEPDWNEIYWLAEEQSVIGIALAGIERLKSANVNLNLSQELLLQLIGEAQMLEQQNKAMNQFIAELIEKMRIDGIYALLVKGQGVAQCYEKPLWRSSGDVDLLLSEDNYKKAIPFLTPLASAVEDEVIFSKHIAMTIEGWEVELHGSLHGGLWSSVDGGLDKVQEAIFNDGSVRSWSNGGTQVFLPRANEDAVYVFAHILEHFFYGGVGLRQVCDWCRLLWCYQSELDLRLLESRIQGMGVMSEWRAFGSLAVDFLGMPAEAMPMYDSSFKHKGERILKFILEVGNFGHNRDKSYYKTEPYLKRKAISFWRHTTDGAKYFCIFPMDSLRLWWKMLTHGVLAVFQRR